MKNTPTAVIQRPPRTRYIQSPGGVRIRNQEMVFSMTSHATDDTKMWVGIGSDRFSSFVWLHNIARSYGSFRVHSLRVYALSKNPLLAGRAHIAWVPDLNDASTWYNNGAVAALNHYNHSVHVPLFALDGSLRTSVTVSGQHIHSIMPRFLIQAGAGGNMNSAGGLCLAVEKNSGGTVDDAVDFYVDYDIEFFDAVVAQLNAKSASKPGGDLPIPTDSIPPSHAPQPTPPKPAISTAPEGDTESP